MWEIIAANQRKSVFIVLMMGLLLLGLGYVIGEASMGPGGGVLGLWVSGAIWAGMTVVSYFQGDSILLRSSRAHEITPEVHPELFNVVEEMKIAANLPAMPRVYVIDDPGLNAFATGTRPDKSSVAVTAGLLSRLNRDELQGVIAHEISHILNRDVLYMTLAGVMLGSMQMISHFFMRGLWYGSYSGGNSPNSSRRYRSERSSSSGGGQGQVLMIVAAVFFAIVGPILAQVFYFSLSRKREYLADASGARLTRYPEGLASALEKISGRAALADASAVTAPMYIEKPNEKSMGVIGLFSTHPPIDKRIAILRAMNGSGYGAYAISAKKVLNGDAMVPKSAAAEGSMAARTASVSIPVGLGKLQTPARAAGDLMRAVNGFTFLTSSCGLKLKLPPEYSRPTINCPKCNETLSVSSQNPSSSPAVSQTPPGWRTLVCACGHPITLSPAFTSPYAICKSCSSKISISS
jgi:heat shock protein HtpX